MNSIQAMRGTRDILPAEIDRWQKLEALAHQFLCQAAYQEIRTPVFEQTDLFERGIGEVTDVVGKEMYSFQDRGERCLTLRPEGTAGVVRAFIEHGLFSQGLQRLWYTGPMFRYERPQAGRQRQFHQLGVELLGSADIRADAEVVAIAMDLLHRFGLADLTLQINSIGDPADRQQYRAALVDYLTPYQADLDPDSQHRLSQNPLRILDSKATATQAILQDAPRLGQFLSAESGRRFEQIKALLGDLGIDCVVNDRLVRGLDYYTHTVFEIQSDSLGAQATVCAGGRYDGLVMQLGGPDTPAVGWAMGLERLVILLSQLQPPPGRCLDFYIASRGERAQSQALKLAQSLRRADFSAELDLSGSALGKQLKRADRSGAIGGLILAESEADTQTVQLKWLGTGTQQTLTQTEFLQNAEHLRGQINQQRSAMGNPGIAAKT